MKAQNEIRFIMGLTSGGFGGTIGLLIGGPYIFILGIGAGYIGGKLGGILDDDVTEIEIEKTMKDIDKIKRKCPSILVGEALKIKIENELAR